MGKRSNFERVERDYYPTPYEAVVPLLEHLGTGLRFIEPCAGDGRLIDHLERHGNECVLSIDIEPRREDICKGFAGDVYDWVVDGDYGHIDYIITNPPWRRGILHNLIHKFTIVAPTWLLFDADWMHTKQAAPYLPKLAKIVSVGRVKWIEGSKMTGKDNCCWYLFTDVPNNHTQFYGRKS